MTQRISRPAPRPKTAIRSYAKTAYREAILAAAERRFLAEGYHDTRMVDIAADASVSVGTLYKHFPSKDAVFESLAARGREEALELLRECLEQPGPEAQLQAIVERLFSHVEKQNAVFAVLAELSPAGEIRAPADMRDEEDRAVLEVVALMETAFTAGTASGLFRADAAPRLLAAMFVGAMRGVLQAWLDSQRAYSLSSQAQPLLRTFLEGAFAR